MTDMTARRAQNELACAVIIILSAASDIVAAAGVEMPPRAPPAALFQDVGLTRISVEYRSPAVRGRPIWGARVPLGEPWRSGDSPQATITFSRDVTVGGKAVPAGTYALVPTPSPTSWTFALQSGSGAGTSEATREIARVATVVEAVEPRERLRFVFSTFTTSSARLDLEWERVRVSLPIEVDTNGQILSAIAALDRRDPALGHEYAEAGAYLLSKKNDEAGHERGLAYLERAAALSDRSAALTGKAQLVEGPGVASVTLPSPSERGAPEIAHVKTATRAPGADEIGPIIERGRPAIQSCYQRALRRDPSLARGRITVSIAIGTVGLVRGVVVEAPEGLRPVEACVRAAVSRWVFPPSPAAYTAELPLVLDRHD